MKKLDAKLDGAATGVYLITVTPLLKVVRWICPAPTAWLISVWSQAFDIHYATVSRNIKKGAEKV